MNTISAFLIHLLTASGGAFALLALMSAAEKQWADMFWWLFAAQVVDGIDGPLARKFEVSKHLPNWSGDSLDYVIDFATYVFIPAFAIATAGFIPTPYGLIAACIIVVSGGLYFADNRMKTKTNAFRGFPAVWNGVLFYLFLYMPDPIVSFILIVLLAAGQFFPVEFVHPVRVAKYRMITLSIMAVWAVFAFRVIINEMIPTNTDMIVLGITGFYLFAIGPIMHYTRVFLDKND